MEKVAQRAYLARLGLEEPASPTLDYLKELHRAHVTRIPWETVDIFAGKPMPIDVAQSVRLLIEGRSGYCFHLNGAFSALLRSLGYRVHWHRAGVQPKGEAPRVNGYHLGLTVELADDAGILRRWIVDAGLGDMPYEPLPLQPDEYAQGPLRYRVADSSVARGGWRLEHDPLASFPGVDYAPEIVDGIEAFVPQHEEYCHSPQSPWRNLFLVRHRHAAGSNELRGCVWSKRDEDGVTKTELTSRNMWLELLADVFGERLVRYSPIEREELWRKAWLLHEKWKRAQARVDG